MSASRMAVLHGREASVSLADLARAAGRSYDLTLLVEEELDPLYVDAVLVDPVSRPPGPTSSTPRLEPAPRAPGRVAADQSESAWTRSARSSLLHPAKRSARRVGPVTTDPLLLGWPCIRQTRPPRDATRVSPN